MRFDLFFALIVGSFSASFVQADATLEYALDDTDASTVIKKISIARFFARIDSTDRPNEYLLFQAGKFFPLYRVDTAKSTYTLLTSQVTPTQPAGQTESSFITPSQQNDKGDKARQWASESPVAQVIDTKQPSNSASDRNDTPGATVFKPTSKLDNVAGAKCRVVLEMVDGKPAIEHCMANKIDLDITERESRTLARLFVMARKQGYGWLGTASEDEDYVSVRSKIPHQAKTLELVSVSTKPLQRSYLKVPSGYEEVKVASTSETSAAQNANSDSDSTRPKE